MEDTGCEWNEKQNATNKPWILWFLLLSGSVGDINLKMITWHQNRRETCVTRHAACYRYMYHIAVTPHGRHSTRMHHINKKVAKVGKKPWKNNEPISCRAGHYSDGIMSAVASQIAGDSMVCSTYFQAQVKENIKAPRLWPLWGEFTDDRWIHLTKGQ